MSNTSLLDQARNLLGGSGLTLGLGTLATACGDIQAASIQNGFSDLGVINTSTAFYRISSGVGQTSSLASFGSVSSFNGDQAIKIQGSSSVIQPSLITPPDMAIIDEIQFVWTGNYFGVNETSIPAHQPFTLAYDFNIVASPGVSTSVTLTTAFTSLPGTPGFNVDLGTGLGNRSFSGSLVQDIINSDFPTPANGIPYQVSLKLVTDFPGQLNTLQVVIPGNSIDFGNFTPVPEPSAYAAVAGLAVLVLARRRRR